MDQRYEGDVLEPGLIPEVRQQAVHRRVLALPRHFIRRGINYVILVIWLLKRSFKGRPLKLLFVVALSSLFLLGQVAALSSLYWYGQQLQAGTGLQIASLGVKLDADDPRLLWAVVILTTSSFAMSAAFIFFSRSLVMRIAEQDFVIGIKQLIAAAARLPDPRAYTASRLLSRFRFGEIAAGCRLGGMMVVMLAGATPRAVVGLSAGAFLFWMAPYLTALVLSAAIVWALLLYPLALRAVEFSKRRHSAMGKFRREVPNFLAGSDGVASVARFDRIVEEVARATMGKRRVANEMTLVGDVGAAVIIAFAIGYLATTVTGNDGWPIILAYVITARLALIGWLQGLRAFASVSRYYPELVRFYLFQQDASRIDDTPFAQVSTGDVLRLGMLPDGSAVEITTGQRIAVLTRDEIPVLLFALVHTRAVKSNLPVKTVWVGFPVIEAKLSGASIVLLEATDVERTSTAEISELIDDKVALIVHRNEKDVGRFGESHLAVMDEGAIQVFCERCSPEGLSAINQWSARGDAKRKAATLTDYLEDEEEL